MSWRAAGDLYRQPISIDNTAGGAGSFDATVAIPTDWDAFWTTVQSDGDDIRVTRSDGVTLVTKYDLAAGFNTSTRSGTLEIQDTAAAAGMLNYWMYWGDSSLTSGVTAFAPASAKTAYLDLGNSVKPYTFRAQAQERPGDATPVNTMAKTPGTTIWLWLDFSALLQKRVDPHPSQTSLEYECLSYATVTASGSGLTATATATRFEVGRADAAIVRCQISAGNSGTDYLVTVTAVTSLGRTLTGVVQVQCLEMA